jgi:FlaG/FlaF family flagellin (archaellin)
MLHGRGSNENTVSPVIGVMLMLVVTSGSRCGIATGKRPVRSAPAADLEPENNGGCASFPVEIRDSCATIL